MEGIWDEILDACNLDFSMLDGRTVLITGATGLVGFNLISVLVSLSCDMKVVAVVRNLEKAEKIYKNISRDKLRFVIGDVRYPMDIDGPVDYIIHAASQTSSRSFVCEPVETILTSVLGTRNMLELAKAKKVIGFVYLSSMEVYGTPDTDEKISEEHGTNLDTMSVRSSYPESKRMCEALCRAYCEEYGVPIKVLRLTQTFGPGVTYADGRVFAEFARCAIEERDIVLRTKGETRRNYLYTLDAVSAILTVLLKGVNGQAYNVANEETYCSILEMARMVADRCAENHIKVVIDIDDGNQLGYAPTLRMNLDTSKLKDLGWKPKVGLEDMFHSLIKDMKQKKYGHKDA